VGKSVEKKKAEGRGSTTAKGGKYSKTNGKQAGALGYPALSNWLTKKPKRREKGNGSSDPASNS